MHSRHSEYSWVQSDCRLPNGRTLAGEYGPEVVEQWGGLGKVLSLPRNEPAVLSWVNDRANWAHNRFYLEWAVPQGIFDVMAVVLVQNAHVLGSVALGRHVSAGPITQREVDAARLVVPHLQRATAIGMLLDLRTVVGQELEATLDTLATGIVLVDVDMRIVHANAAAEALLATGDPISSKAGRLAVRSVPVRIDLAVRTASADETRLGRRGFGIPASCEDGTAYVVHVLPLRGGDIRPGLSRRAAAAVFVAAANSAAPPEAEILAALFDLTPAEARVFSLIGSGLSPPEIARPLGVAHGTVKTQLHNLFAKTGTHRQAELVKLAGSYGLNLG